MENRFEDNPVTRLFNIEYPIVQGGMVWAAGWRLATAVSEAGCLGLIGAGSMTPELLEHHIDRAFECTGKPFGVNIPLGSPHGDTHVRTCLRKGVKIVFTAAGSPKIHTSALKEAGVTVAHVVPSAKLAKKVEAAGCDAVVAEGNEAGGHNGREGLTSLVLWPSAARAVDIPMIATGGIGDGYGMAAAFMLGAGGVQLGTRFAVTVESTASDAYKAACVRADGGDARIYNTANMPMRSLGNSYVEEFLAMERSGASTEELRGFRGKGRSRSGVFEGDVDNGDLVAGQVCESIVDVPTVSELVSRLVAQFEDALAFRAVAKQPAIL